MTTILGFIVALVVLALIAITGLYALVRKGVARVTWAGKDVFK